MADVRGTLVKAGSVIGGALACLGLLGAPALSSTSRTIVVAQENNDGSALFGYRADYGHVQKSAQTFTAPEDDVKRKSLALWLGGHATAVVKVFKVRHHAPMGKLVATVRYRVKRVLSDPANGWHRLAIEPGIAMDKGDVYSFVLAVKGKSSYLTSRGGGGYKSGREYCLCPTVKKNTVDYDHFTWRTHNLIGDLGFKLRFSRVAATQ